MHKQYSVTLIASIKTKFKVKLDPSVPIENSLS